MKLPPLPEPRPTFTPEDMRAYGEASFRAGAESAGLEAWQLCHDTEFARFTAEGIQRLKIGAPALVLLTGLPATVEKS